MEFCTSYISQRTRLQRSRYEEALDKRKKKKQAGLKEVDGHAPKRDYESKDHEVIDAEKFLQQEPQVKAKGVAGLQEGDGHALKKDYVSDDHEVINVEKFLQQERRVKARYVAVKGVRGRKSGHGSKRHFGSRQQFSEADEVEHFSADKFEEKDCEANGINYESDDLGTVQEIDETEFLRLISKSRNINAAKGTNTSVSFASESENDDDFDEISSSSETDPENESEEDSDDEDFVMEEDCPSVTIVEMSSDSKEVDEDEKEKVLSEESDHIHSEDVCRKEAEVKNCTERKQSTGSSDSVIGTSVAETSLKKRRYNGLKKNKKLDSEGECDADVCTPTNEHNVTHKQEILKQIDDFSAGEEMKRLTKRMRVSVATSENILNVLDSILEKGNLLDEEACAEEEPSEKEGLPLKFRFEDEDEDEDEYPPKVQKSEFDLMADGLFAELEYALICEETASLELSKVDNEKEDDDSQTETNQFILCCRGKHQLFFDEQIGMRCRCCEEVLIESKYVLPPLVKFTTKVQVRRVCQRLVLQDRNESAMFDALENAAPVKNFTGFCNNEGTVWDLMPNTQETLYPHQREGFEFLWKNLMGTMNLLELKNNDRNGVGGCIISHAPGTGKSRLTLVFIESFLRIFPNSLPVIIAPASVLLTWEEEFKKWNVNSPFYNLNALKLRQSKDVARVKKLFYWSKGRSILGVSYNMYEKLAGEKLIKGNGRKKRVKSVLSEGLEKIRKILLELPGLVILDEGHTPRNQRSCIWNTILKLRTEKRVILSGTPFQNNFGELSNTLRLVRPETASALAEEEDFADMIKLRKRRQRGIKDTSLPSLSGKYIEKAVEKLNEAIGPFVHAHNGSILQERLPGLRDCLILLSPSPLQKRLINGIEVSKNSFESDHKVALVSVHPSLVVHCGNLSDEEKSLMKPEQLKELRLKPEEGVKIRFLVKFIPLCLARNEKVLIFSQFKEPSNFIKEQLGEILGGDVEKKVLQLEGKTNQRQRKKLIQVFNDPNSEAVVMLASTKCCSEGIHLVGASRVVLLDVVWNPSVERQAICRAYRLGQMKVVHTYHLITSGTTEWEKYCRQDEKDRFSALLFPSSTRHRNGGKNQPLSTKTDVVLDDMISQPTLTDMFEDIIHQPKERRLLDSFSLIS